MKKTTAIDILEILALLGLPMLSSRINIFYIILVIIIILVSRFLRKEKWAEYGFKPVSFKLMLLSAGIGIAFALVDNYFLEPLVSGITGKSPDLSTFDNVKGNIKQFLMLLAIGWVIGGFFEETFFRGYLLNRINLLIKNQSVSKWAGIIFTSLSFAIAHSYQDTGGIVNTFYFSIVLALLYYYLGKNVWYAILIHGFYDTVGIIYLFLGK